MPASAVYGWVSGRKTNSVKPHKLPVLVICIGNLVAGGAGKTPVALAIGATLKALGKRAHYLSRGYKSAIDGVLLVDPAKHTAQEVGDEPLLLAEVLPTWVAKDRVAGAVEAIAAGAEIIIMDDGFQNPYLHKDVSLLVIDGQYGFGNERLLPAGPLREPISAAMERASAIIMIGDDQNEVLHHVPSSLPILRAKLQPTPAAHFLHDKPVVAFCGIARPRKFYRTLQQIGCVIRKSVSYSDHYNFKPKDLEFLRSKAKEFGATLVTTTKDYVRLPADMRPEVTQVPVEILFEDNATLLKTILK